MPPRAPDHTGLVVKQAGDTSAVDSPDDRPLSSFFFLPSQTLTRMIPWPLSTQRPSHWEEAGFDVFAFSAFLNGPAAWTEARTKGLIAHPFDLWLEFFGVCVLRTFFSPVLARAVGKTGPTSTGGGEGMPAFDCRPASRRPPGCLSSTLAGFDGGCAPLRDVLPKFYCRHTSPAVHLLLVQPLA